MREPASARTKKNVYCSIRISLRQFQENKKRPRVFLFYYQKYNLSQKGGCHVFLRQRVHVSTSGDPWDVQHSRTWTRTLGTCCTRGANVMNIFEHFRTFSNIFEHFRTFSNIFEHFRTFSNIFTKYIVIPDVMIIFLCIHKLLYFESKPPCLRIITFQGPMLWLKNIFSPKIWRNIWRFLLITFVLGQRSFFAENSKKVIITSTPDYRK
jgi:hypothetical protein